MGNPKGFIEIPKKESGYRPVKERIYDFGEVEQTLNEKDRKDQASRCMDCGIPFCHWACPVTSKIPEWQDAIYLGKWEEAYDILSSTNSFPEFTGRVCPAPCEKSCVLAIHEESVTIRENEASVVEQAFDRGYVQARVPEVRTGKKVAVIGSGPAGMSAADVLNQAGHSVTVFEQDDAIGGLLRYGIPDFKLNKNVIDRRLELFVTEGIDFKTNTTVGKDITPEQLLKDYDAVCLAVGAMQPRDLVVEGRDLEGVHFAMDFLKQQNKVNRGEVFTEDERISAKEKKVLVIGGGDTGSDCVGTSIRQKAESVTQIEILPKPPEKRADTNPWPYWPNTLRTSSSHLEGCERRWALATKRLIGKDGKVTGAEVVEVVWEKIDGRFQMKEIPGTEELIEVDLVLLSMGFVSPVHEGLLDGLGVEYDERGNVKAVTNTTSVDKVFAAGDVARGASLVVHAIRSGRDAAGKINEYLMQD
ncbi:glutamate synthase subunit beta [Prolixibacter denitrificans]|uniref:Dihydropyrimidine dehydrogenase subunit A n=1 Tax=Prolixibacter denitrificans TaxID=1541063 RepID=A0A2P8CJT3_9BACT|nr:glutamate synthase subunit beta [Prolixibacter denitrificans]PSK85229.1 glutamate synthase (NADPH/NADH) small chain [Prolixibacter denitrificans]GET19851.1 dihydropyrimidine dehydrogenase subunit A [Prolixibacter denitrificans]